MKGVSLKYLQKYVRMKRIAEFNKKKLFPNLKEVTESMGIVEAASKIEDRNDSSVTLIVVGDGKRPRTATLATNMTKWNAISIDPNMNSRRSIDGICWTCHFVFPALSC